MAEPPSKRPRRPDSKQMWDDSERRTATNPRLRQAPNDGRDSRERDRRYRSRSPRDLRRDRERGDRELGRDSNHAREAEKRGVREHDERGGRRDGRRDGDRSRDKGEYPAGPPRSILAHRPRSDALQDVSRYSRERPRERSRDRQRGTGKRDARSRSPRLERELDDKGTKDSIAGASKSRRVEEEFKKSRTATPPVSFKVGHTTTSPRDHDRMSMDGDTQTNGDRKGKKSKAAEPVEDDDEIVVEDDSMDAMKTMMGFGGFSTTHQKKVPGNDVYAVRKEKKTEYRQYMNRVGGFNRPLSPTRD